MASDGKGQRKFHKYFCAKCADSGWVYEWGRSKGKVTSPKAIPCRKNCPAAQRWKKEHGLA